ncbi:hypothetical protein HKX48_003917 [Thoreauomyces humboldtii]|nr:hypothetical protein HKX48_003917 [Thoreauomyces humboldtii]
MTYNAEKPPDSLSSAEGGAPAGAGQVDAFKDAVERAKAIAAKLSALSEIPDDFTANPSVSNPGKRSHSEVDEYRPPSSGYRREDFQPESKRPAPDNDRSDHYGPGGGAGAGGGGGAGGRPRFGLGHSDAPSSGGMSQYDQGGPSGRPGQTSEEMSVPNAYVGLIIGRAGENMKRIENTCNVKVQFTPANGGELDRRTTITGAREDVAEAKRMIQEQINTPIGGPRSAGPGPSPSSYGPPSFNNNAQQGENMSIPGHKVGLVIGRGGETINSLQDRSGARITVVPEGPQDQQSGMRTLQISGGPGSIDMARNLIDELVNAPPPGRGPMGGGMGMGGMGMGGGMGGPGMGMGMGMNPVEVIKVHTERVGLVIGKGGEIVKSIQQQCDVRIKIDSTPDQEGNRTVTISGPAQNIERAKEMVMERVESRRDFGHGGGGGGYGGHQGGYGGGGGGYGGYGGQQQSGYQNQQYQQPQHQQQPHSGYDAAGAAAGGQQYDEAAWAAYYAQCQAYYAQHPEQYPAGDAAAYYQQDQQQQQQQPPADAEANVSAAVEVPEGSEAAVDKDQEPQVSEADAPPPVPAATEPSETDSAPPSTSR